MKKKAWFTIDIDKALRDAGFDPGPGQSFGKVEFFEVSSGFASKPEPTPPKAPTIVPDENGRLRLGGRP